MTRNQVLETLRAHEAELRATGVAAASLFGSMARGEASPADIDIAVRLSPGFSKGGFHYFGRLEALERQFSQLLGCVVDVVEEPVRRAQFQSEIDRDRQIAF